MAGASTEQGNGSLNVDLNLVPFIDLLSTLVLFLLVTAVWLQVSAIPAAVDSKGKATVSFSPKDKIMIQVTGSGYRISWPGGLSGHGLPLAISRVGAKYEFDKLAAVLIKAGSVAGGLAKLPMTAVGGEDSVPYEAIVQALDAAKTAGIHSVALSTE